MSLRTYFFQGIIVCLVFPFLSVNAAEDSSRVMPEPLTLELALSLIDQQHPDLRQLEAEAQSAQSDYLKAQANDDFSVNLKADARWVEPSKLSPNQSQEDHRLGLFVNKTLYDFGRHAAQMEQASQAVVSRDLYYLNAKQRQHIKVMKSYFDVVLADLQFYRYNEEMAVAYIQYDRMKIRQQLGQYTELDVAEKEAEYQRIRRMRTYSQNQQRVTRSLLAQALNKPNHLPATVARPDLDVTSRKLPEVEVLQKQASENNSVLQALHAQINAAKNNVELARASGRPVLSAGLEAYEYKRELASSDKWRAGITLDVPLWNGERIDAAVAKAKANLYKTEAQLSQQEFAINQKILELWLGIETLRVKYDEDSVAMNFAELSLDKMRAQYEQEVKADLGYAMVKFSEAERKVMETKFKITLAWAELDALSGNLLKNTNQQ